MRAVLQQYPLIPNEAFLFFPCEDQIFTMRNNKRPYRIIFDGGVSFTPYQKQKLSQLQNELKQDSKNHQLSFYTEATLLRFLQATKYDIEDCVKQLKKYKKWEDRMLPLHLTPEVQNILKKGLFYMTGRDINYRPIIVVNVQRIIDLDLKQKVFQDVAGYFFEYIVENCMIEGQVQTWITIVDLGKLGMFSMAGTVIDTISFLSSHFKCRLHHSYLLNCPGSISFLFGMIKRAMSEDQIMKITLVQQPTLPKQAFANVFEDEIQLKYGGTHEDYADFWPCRLGPRVLSGEQSSRLISLQEYAQMNSKGLLNKKKVNKQLLSLYHNQVLYEKELAEQKPCGMVEEEVESQIDAEILKEDQPQEIPEVPMPIDIDSLFGFTCPI